jgi:Fic family protein
MIASAEGQTVEKLEASNQSEAADRAPELIVFSILRASQCFQCKTERSEGSSQRFYSMSAQIWQERAAYYDILEQTQKGGMDITRWMVWFLGCLGRAIEGAQATVGTVLAKARFWESAGDSRLNERQRLVLNRLLDGLEGKLTTSKWAKLANCSHDTALRDIAALVEGGFLVRNPGGGRSTSYALRKTTESSGG